MTHSCSKEANILYKLHILNKEVSSKFEGCTGISQSRLELMIQLFQVEEISQKDLQKEIGIDHAAITRHLKQLEMSELISRRKNPNDHRVTLVSLTTLGRDQMSAFEEEKEQFATSVLKDMTDEERDFLFTLLNRMQANIAKL